MWDNVSWTTLGTGMSGGNPTQVLALAMFNSSPHAGGNFNVAGGVTVNNVTRWDGPTGIITGNSGIPQAYSLQQNYPNPFNPTTSIAFMIANTGFTTLKVYNLLGSEVATLVNSNLTPGSYEVKLDASDLASGVYYYKLVSGNFESVKKLVVVK